MAECDWEDRIASGADGALDDTARAHLAGCAECRRTLAAVRALAAAGALAKRTATTRLPDAGALVALAGPDGFRDRARASRSHDVRAALRPIVWVERIGAALVIAAVLAAAGWGMSRVPAPALPSAQLNPATYVAAGVLALVIAARALLGLAQDEGAHG